MRTVKLESISLHNFAGVRSQTITAAGQSLLITGKNATGKTTIADAYHWLLFGRDSQERADFSPVTLSADGNPIDGLDHEVTAVISVNGREMTLTKTLRQKWTKKRGHSTAHFAGHETAHEIDGVPLTATEYRRRVDDIIPAAAWSLLTNPLAFNGLHWQDRRQKLLSITGGVSLREAAGENLDLLNLLENMGDRSPADYKKMLMAQRRKLADDLKTLPVRIDEATPREQPTVSLEAAAVALATAEENLNIATSRAAEALANNPATAAAQELTAARARYAARKAEAERQLADRRYTLEREAAAAARSRLDAVETAERHAARAERAEARAAELREEWATVRAAPLTATVCHACQQELPDGAETAAARRAADLKRIDAEGIAATQEAEAARAGIEELTARAEDFRQKETRFRAELDDLPAEATVDPDPLIEQLEAELAAAETTSADTALQDAVTAAREAYATATREHLAAEAHAQALERAAALTEELRERSRQLEEAEQHLHFTEEIMRAQARLLENRVNSLFPRVRFKLFNELVNGGLEETCEATLDGVPFRSLNTAAQVQAGIEIINALQTQEKTIAPIIVDGRESILTLPDTPAQTISLQVSDAAETLTIQAPAV